MFTPIGKILPTVLQKGGLAEHARRVHALRRFEEVAKGALADSQRDDFKVRQDAQAVVTVTCRSSAVALKLRAKEGELLVALRADGADVERLRFIISPWR